MSRQWAVVTGAANGIGRALCTTLCTTLGTTADLHILAVDKDVQGLTTLAAQHPCRVHPLTADLSDLSYVDAICGAIPEGDTLRFVVFNAAHVTIKLFPDLTPELLDYTLKVNVISSFFLTQRLHPRLEESGGRILMVGANPGVRPQKGLAAYGLSKAANLHLYKTFKTEFAESRVSTAYVMPGGVDTKAFHDDAAIAKELDLPLSGMLEKCLEAGLISPSTVAAFYKFLLCDTEDGEYEREWHIEDKEHWARWREDVNLPLQG